MYIVSISRNFKISTNSDNLFFRGKTVSIPLTEVQLKNLMLRCKCYRFRDQLFSCKTETPIGRIVYDDSVVAVELEPIEEVVKVKATKKTIKTTKNKPVKPIDLISIDEAEKLLISQALIASNGNRAKSSAMLGICVRSIRSKIKKYAIDPMSIVEVDTAIVTFKESETYLVNLALKFTNYNKQESARLLGISRRGLEYKITQLNIDTKCYKK